MPIVIPMMLCTVVGVSDGDTLTARCPSATLRVRLAEIDAPEKAQAFGQRAKQSLSEMCFGKTAEIRTQAQDRYGRTVARVTCNGVDANAMQIQRGLAWVYDRYVTDRDLYALQDAARQARSGLWSDNTPTPPWDWRHARRY